METALRAGRDMIQSLKSHIYSPPVNAASSILLIPFLLLCRYWLYHREYLRVLRRWNPSLYYEALHAIQDETHMPGVPIWLKHNAGYRRCVILPVLGAILEEEVVRENFLSVFASLKYGGFFETPDLYFQPVADRRVGGGLLLIIEEIFRDSPYYLGVLARPNMEEKRCGQKRNKPRSKRSNR